MKKENKEMLKEILSNQKLIMKALNIATPAVAVVKKSVPKSLVAKKTLIKKAVKKVSK